MEEILKVIEPTLVYLLLTWAYCFLSINKNNTNYKIVFTILSVMLLTEVLSSVFLFYGKTIDYIYCLNIPIHHFLWIWLLYKNTSDKYILKILASFYLAFILYDFIFNRGLAECNYYIFIIGALIYVAFFIYVSVKKLKYEEFNFFLSNTYLLLFTPLIFFIGISSVFAFESPELAKKEIVAELNLYQIIGYFVNFIYYTLINIYIYFENKKRHVRLHS